MDSCNMPYNCTKTSQDDIPWSMNVQLDCVSNTCIHAMKNAFLQNMKPTQLMEMSPIQRKTKIYGHQTHVMSHHLLPAKHVSQQLFNLQEYIT